MFEILVMKTLAGLKMGLFYEWWKDLWNISKCEIIGVKRSDFEVNKYFSVIFTEKLCKECFINTFSSWIETLKIP